MDILDDLKARARALHAAVRRGEPTAAARVRALPELRSLDEARLASDVQRRHCLATLARELGFDGWSHVTAVLKGASVADFGTLLYPKHFSAYWNIWSASYDEASAIRREHGGYLLAYKRHFFICDRYFVEALGLDPDDPDWERIGRDWVRPAAPEARGRLYATLIRQQIAAA